MDHRELFARIFGYGSPEAFLAAVPTRVAHQCESPRAWWRATSQGIPDDREAAALVRSGAQLVLP
jgi:hypothetical protein